MLDKLIRYGVVERILGPNPKGTLLEVGAGPQGLGACLPYRFVGVDPWYPEPPVAAQSAVRASATALPFPDQSFDVVLCIETLEHISHPLRKQVAAELLRVARRKVIITHPFGWLGRLGDMLLVMQYALLRPLGIKQPWWLHEHFENPLPDPREYLKDVRVEFKRVERGQENWFLHNPAVFVGNLKWVARAVKRAYAKNPEQVKAWVRRMDFPPYYRRLLILERL
jgi:SAM-dependent methyltransferase